jgi:hypothetical protein
MSAKARHETGVVPANAGTHSPCAGEFLLSQSLRLRASPLLRRMGPRVRGDDKQREGRA